MGTTLSDKLLHTLTAGKERLGGEALRRVRGFVASQCTAEDAFVNKTGETDLYYTSFGWLLSYLLGIGLNPEKRATYLHKQPVAAMDLVHYAAYMRCLLLHRLMKWGKLPFLVGGMRRVPVRELDSFEQLPHGDRWSPYTQFVWLSLREDARKKGKGDRETLERLKHYRVAGGGYSNVRDRKAAATNATVAALSVIGQVKGYEPDNKDVLYLRNCQEETGGFNAGEEAFIPDLLSTATALFLLKGYGVRPLRSANDFVEAHWLDSGGFAATLLEDDSDVEYVFYGLLALGAV